jgi:hypothetical protein
MAEAVQAKMEAMALDPVAERKPYYQKRIDLFSKYVEREKAQVEAARAAGVAIKVVLPDASVKQGVKGATTPLDIANEISKSLAKKCVVAKVDGETWDLFRPLEGDCALQLLSFEDPDGREVRRRGRRDARRARLAARPARWPLAAGRRLLAPKPCQLRPRRGAARWLPPCSSGLAPAGPGPSPSCPSWRARISKQGSRGSQPWQAASPPTPRRRPPPQSQTFWHSSAHVLGEALELEYGVDLTIGPALEEGFYYDCYMGDRCAEAAAPPHARRSRAPARRRAGAPLRRHAAAGAGAQPPPPPPPRPSPRRRRAGR